MIKPKQNTSEIMFLRTCQNTWFIIKYSSILFNFSQLTRTFFCIQWKNLNNFLIAWQAKFANVNVTA